MAQQFRFRWLPVGQNTGTRAKPVPDRPGEPERSAWNTDRCGRSWTTTAGFDVDADAIHAAGDATVRSAGSLPRMPTDCSDRWRFSASVGNARCADHGSRSASEIAGHQSAIDRFLQTGDETVLEPFRGRRRGGVELNADPDDIERAAREGTLDDLKPYVRSRV